MCKSETLSMHSWNLPSSWGRSCHWDAFHCLRSLKFLHHQWWPHGFFNSCCIGAGDFCGEELLTWALDPRPNVVLPSSTRTVEAITEVEAFALISEDLKFAAAQFRRLHSKQIRHTFRSHLHQWRTWAACFIQAAWFWYKRQKEAAKLKKRETLKTSVPKSAVEESAPLPPHCSGFTIYGAKLAASTRRGGSMRSCSEFDILSSLQKPVEPDFATEDC